MWEEKKNSELKASSGKNHILLLLASIDFEAMQHRRAFLQKAHDLAKLTALQAGLEASTATI